LSAKHVLANSLIKLSFDLPDLPTGTSILDNEKIARDQLLSSLKKAVGDSVNEMTSLDVPFDLGNDGEKC
jgi:hypothetical protein